MNRVCIISCASLFYQKFLPKSYLPSNLVIKSGFIITAITKERMLSITDLELTSAEKTAFHKISVTFSFYKYKEIATDIVPPITTNVESSILA